MRFGHAEQFFFGFRQRYVQDRFTAPGALDQELHRQRGLAGPGHTFDQVKPMRSKASAKNVIETFDARRGADLATRICGWNGG